MATAHEYAQSIAAAAARLQETLDKLPHDVYQAIQEELATIDATIDGLTTYVEEFEA
ncbi:MAG: hypothetical protein ACRD0J_14170 [Acidimicrobiales bacterium]